MKGLILHCGGGAVSREQLEVIPTPTATATWQPIPHGTLVSRVQDTLGRSGLIVAEEAHGVTADGNRYFGLLRIQAESVLGDGGDFGLVVGVRNSHDKSFPAGLVVGASVFVCDNLSFSGEIKIARKHTVRIMDDLPNLIEGAVGRIGTLRKTQEQRFLAYQGHEISDREAHDLFIQALDAKVLPVTRLPLAIEEWRTPRHPEFREGGKTAWRLFNSISESLKGNLDALPRRTTALHGLMDTACKLIVTVPAVSSEAQFAHAV
jgi:hypothetical protein